MRRPMALELVESGSAESPGGSAVVYSSIPVHEHDSFSV